MSRRMSCSMTVDAVRSRQKVVTRRHPDTWRTLKAGDRLTLIEKGMGLPKGSKQVVLAEVEVVDVRVEPIGLLIRGAIPGAVDLRYGREEVRREGFPQWVDTPADFVRLWCGSHGYGPLIGSWAAGAPVPDEVARVLCRRIEWRYLDRADQ